MKKLYSLAVAVILMTGCSYKNESIELYSYHATHLNATTKNMDNISYLSVSDTREEKTEIGYVEANGQRTAKLFSYVNFADRYKETLIQVLKDSKFNLVENPESANTKINVNIKDIQIVYNDTNKFDQNLHGKIVIEVTMTKGGKTITQTFTQDEGKWIKPSYTSKDIEPLLYSLFADSIDTITAKLATQSL